MFAPAPILAGEDANAYKSLLSRVWDTVKPSDTIEEIWVREVVDASWESNRYRRWKTLLIEASIPTALCAALEPIINEQIRLGGDVLQIMRIDVGETPSPTERLIARWAFRDPDAVKHVRDILAVAKVTMEQINARAMALALDEITHVDRLLARVEVSRNAILEEIDRRRSRFAERLRDATQDAMEAEFEEISP
jgi:hypothetical protein